MKRWLLISFETFFFYAFDTFVPYYIYLEF